MLVEIVMQKGSKAVSSETWSDVSMIKKIAE